MSLSIVFKWGSWKGWDFRKNSKEWHYKAVRPLEKGYIPWKAGPLATGRVGNGKVHGPWSLTDVLLWAWNHRVLATVVASVSNDQQQGKAPTGTLQTLPALP